MENKCSICAHRKRMEIDQALVDGVSLRNIAKQFGSSPATLFRHKSEHLAQQLVQAKAEAVVRQESEHRSSLQVYFDQAVDKTDRLSEAASLILQEATNAKDLRTALSAIRELVRIEAERRSLRELLARAQNELSQQSDVTNITNVVYLPNPQMQPQAEPAEIWDVEDVSPR